MITLKKGPATYTGDISAVGEIKIEENITVDGVVTAGGPLTLSSNVTLGAGSTGNASVDAIPLPTLSFSTSGDDILVDVNQTLALSPDSYKKIEVKEGATLQLSTGVYFFEDLIMSDGAFLEVDLSTGPVEVNVTKNIDIKKDLAMTLTPLGEVDSQYLTFNVMEEVKIGEQSEFLGQLIALNKVTLSTGAKFRGSVCTNEVAVGKDAVLLHHDAPGTINPTAPIGDFVTGVSGEVVIPNGYALQQNHPNPFNPSTTITFAVPELSEVTLAIYNLRGQLIRTLHTGQIGAGFHNVIWNGTDNQGNSVTSGIYFYVLKAGNYSQVKKMSFLK